MSYLPGDEPATKADISLLREELSGRMDGLEQRMDRFDLRMDRFEDKLDGFHLALLTQSRTYLISMVGSILTTAGLVIAITRLT